MKRVNYLDGLTYIRHIVAFHCHSNRHVIKQYGGIWWYKPIQWDILLLKWWP